MHDVGNVEQSCSAVNTELVTLSILLASTVPAALKPLAIYYLIGMLLVLRAKDLRDFITSDQGCSNG